MTTTFRRVVPWPIALAIALPSCGQPPPKSPTQEVSTSIREPFNLLPYEWPARKKSDFELGDDVVPTAYDVELTFPPDGGNDAFTGRVRIELHIETPTSLISLHAVGLTAIEGHIVQGESKPHPVVVHDRSEYEQISLQLPTTLAAGAAILDLSFKGQPSDIGILARGTEIFTQFEAIYARRAFPCFDEPRFKTPWTLHLEVGRDMLAFANTDRVNVEVTADGRHRRFNFEPTKPLPSYLVAFAAGRLSSTKVPGASIPMHLITTAEQAGSTSTAIKQAPALLGAIEEYLGMQAPYAKQDLVVVPNFAVAGMENPGLISLADFLLPASDSPDAPWGFREVATHEFAHLWFGDLVTMEWWTDVWLNESLARWLTAKLTGTPSKPDVPWTMTKDALEWAQPITQPIDSVEAMHRDWTTELSRPLVPTWNHPLEWAKGEAILTMLEGVVGEERLRDGLKLYLARHADGVATTQDFATAISQGAKRDLRPIVHSYTSQAGFPLVTGTLHCDGQAPSLVLTQEPYRAFHDKGRRAAERWNVPVCVRHSSGQACFELSEVAQTFDLGVGTCPKGLHLNRNGTGYYRFETSEEQALSIARNHESHNPKELEALAYSLVAGLESGDTRIGHALKVFALLAKSTDTDVLRSVAYGFWAVTEFPTTAKEKETFATLVSESLGPAVLQILKTGMNLKKEKLELGRALIPFVREVGRHKGVEREVSRLAKEWSKSRDWHKPDLSFLLRSAFVDDDPKTVASSLSRAKDAGDVEQLYAALGSTASRRAAFDWYKQDAETESWKVDITRVVRLLGGVAPYLANRAFCSEAEAVELRELAGSRTESLTDDEKANLAIVLEANVENIRRCASLRRHHQADLRAFLAATPKRLK